MTDAEQMARRLNDLLPNVCVGALRFWGEWFGRPYDNEHELIGCEANDDVLSLRYKGDEILTVWSPRHLRADKSTFVILHAGRVRWEWFACGRPKISSNRYFMDFSKDMGKISASSNVDWDTQALRPSSKFPAVEIPRFGAG